MSKRFSERRSRTVRFAALIVCALVASLGAQTADQTAVVHVNAAGVQKLRAGATSAATLQVQVEQGYHINSNHPKESYLIASSLTLEPASGISLSSIDWPAAQDRKFSFSDEALSVFEGSFPVKLLLKASSGAKGVHTLKGKLRYQACTDQLCRPPAAAPVEFRVSVR